MTSFTKSERTIFRTHRSVVLALTNIVAYSGLTLMVACGESPTGVPAAPLPTSAALAPSGPSRSSDGAGGVSYVVSQTQSGDTTVTTFVVGTNTNAAATFDITRQSSKIDFPYASESICDPAESSYGPGSTGTWDDSCLPLKRAITITAKAWTDRTTGRLNTDFQPALRFVPNVRKGVTLYMKDALLAGGTRIDYCSAAGCVNEALADPTVATLIDSANGFAVRRIKHFSGYNVVVDFE